MSSAIKSHPILFSGPMVRALLAGTKTQTRRIVKPQPKFYPSASGGCYGWDGEGKPVAKYAPGDRLWVKETFQYTDHTINDQPGVVYKATDPDWESMEGWKWKPSIFMPRSASRITLEVTSVRVERLQEIGNDGRKAKDVLAEGVTQEAIDIERKWFHPDDSPARAFAHIWESINGNTYPWSSNPWVWVYEFKRLESTDDCPHCGEHARRDAYPTDCPKPPQRWLCGTIEVLPGGDTLRSGDCYQRHIAQLTERNAALEAMLREWIAVVELVDPGVYDDSIDDTNALLRK